MVEIPETTLFHGFEGESGSTCFTPEVLFPACTWFPVLQCISPTSCKAIGHCDKLQQVCTSTIGSCPHLTVKIALLHHCLMKLFCGLHSSRLLLLAFTQKGRGWSHLLCLMMCAVCTAEPYSLQGMACCQERVIGACQAVGRRREQPGDAPRFSTARQGCEARPVLLGDRGTRTHRQRCTGRHSPAAQHSPAPSSPHALQPGHPMSSSGG